MTYRFIQDDDCHWYLVPSDKVERFNQLVDQEEHDQIDFEFGMYIVTHPSVFDVKIIDEE